MEKSTLTASLPPAWYFSDAQFNAEKDNIFKKDWIFLCHTQELPHAGDYITCDIAGVPVIALRDEQNNIQILLNVCRHRAAPLLTAKKGRLEKPVLMCQYHGWCYHTDGSFKHAPFVTTTCEALNLRKIYYQEARGLLFITFNPEPYPFAQRLDGILQEMDAAKFKIEDYHYCHQIVRVGDFNWKTWTEGFQECYHCPTIHPSFNKDFHLGKYQVHNKDHFSVHTCPRKEESATGKFEGLWLWLFPNCGLPCYENIYYSMRVNPKSASKTELVYTFFAKDSFSTEERNKFFDFVTQITDEDFTICERVQKNLEKATGPHLYDHGFLNMSRENGVHYFHQLVRNAVSLTQCSNVTPLADPCFRNY